MSVQQAHPPRSWSPELTLVSRSLAETLRIAAAWAVLPTLETYDTEPAGAPGSTARPRKAD